MGIHQTKFCAALCFAALAAFATTTLSEASAAGQPPTPAAMAQYRRVLAEYLAAREAYSAAVNVYWTSISAKRRIRSAKRANGEALAIDDYVLAQPPVYTGPPRPKDPSAQTEEPPAEPRYVPVVADFLAAAEKEFKFAPHLPESDTEFKRAYVRTALAAGLTKSQVVRIYGFECGGNGSYDVEAGLEIARPGAHAITTALGYNQLLATNTVEIVAEKGTQFLARLKADAAPLSGREQQVFESKLASFRKMVEFAKSVPDDWNRHQELAGTQKGLAVHAMNLDLDVGPLLQTQKLLDSIVFARRKGYDAMLTAAELEMMNLTGDGNGFDMVTMPQDWRDRVPTANFFLQSGYRENPVAQRNNVVAKLIAATDARMDEEVKKSGAKELAAAFPR
jgi:hypothetical protein